MFQIILFLRFIADLQLFIADLQRFIADLQLFIADLQLFIADLQRFTADLQRFTAVSFYIFLFLSKIVDDKNEHDGEQCAATNACKPLQPVEEIESLKSEEQEAVDHDNDDGVKRIFHWT